MKKICIVLALLLSACGGGSGTTQTPAPQIVTPAIPAPVVVSTTEFIATTTVPTTTTTTIPVPAPAPAPIPVVVTTTTVPTTTTTTIPLAPIIPSTIVPTPGAIYTVTPWSDMRHTTIFGFIDKYIVSTLDFDNTTFYDAKYAPIVNDVMNTAKDHGLNVKSIHAQGITGSGVSVAIIDQNISTITHPEYRGKIAGYYDFVSASYPMVSGSMHGPAVASLLVGTNTGTAPGAKLYFAAVPAWSLDATYYATALDTLIAVNASLPNDQKIRTVSVSAAPSGVGSPYTKGKAEWLAARERAAKAGMYVIDCSSDFAFTAISSYALEDTNDVRKVDLYPTSRLIPNYLYVPSNRSVAIEYDKNDYNYYYTGKGGSSWTVPYVAGLMALGWQLHPELTGEQMKAKLFATAHKNAKGMQVVNPVAFINAIKAL